MRLSFRQGIARYQTDVSSSPIFLRRSVGGGDFVDFIASPDPTVIAFAHGPANYIVEETKSVENAWGPLTGPGVAHLYWDVNLLTAAVTRGVTRFPPMYTGAAPVAPVVDQHWFNTARTVMQVWNGSKWVEKIRVFAGYVTNSAIIHPAQLGSQAGIEGDFEGGNIVLDAYGKPLRQSDGTFVTSATSLIIVNNTAKQVKFEAEIITGMAAEPIPKFSLVQVRADRQIVNGRSTVYMTRIAGMVMEDLYQNEVGYVVPDGLVRNDAWDFPADKINRPFFCGPNGEVTTAPPQAGVSQVCGYVYDRDAVYINIQSPIILDNIYSDLPPEIPPYLAPTANFFTTSTEGIAPFTVNFTSTSIGMPTEFEWDFENSGTIQASGASTSHTYQTPGIYNVRLRAKNAFGHDDHVKTSYIVVTSPAAEMGNTNLGVKLGGPAQVMRNQTFQVSINVSNDGYRTATNVERRLTIPDIKGEAVVISGLPTGSTTSRYSSTLIVKFPNIVTLGSGLTYGPMFFNITAPSRIGTLTIVATVSSPEVDATIGDNTTSLEVEVRP